MGRNIPLVALLIAVSAPLAHAEDAPTWIGKRVVTHYGTVLRVGDQVVDDEKRGDNIAASGRDRSNFRVYRVEETNGRWLWLQAEKEGVAGWVDVGSVVLYDQAIDYFTAQIRANPGSFVDYVRRGNVWHDKGEYDIAIAEYNEAIRLAPSEPTPWMNRGTAWNAKKEYDKAIADYNEAIRLDPKYASAYYNRGIAWRAKKEYDKAIADYNEALRLDPKFALAYFGRGIAWNAKKEYDKAIADYNEAIRLDPKYASAYYNRGIAWRAKKEYDKAIADYNEALRLDPKYALAYNNLAWLWATCPDDKYRDGKKAVESATKACELTEWKDANHVDTLAAAYAEAGDFEKAVQHEEKANALYTDAESKKKGEDRLKLYRDKKPYRQEK